MIIQAIYQKNPVEEAMLDIFHAPRKSWRILSNFFTLVIIFSFIFPVSTQTALAADAPQLIYPANGAYTTPDTDQPLGVPSFSWTAVAGTNKYRLQVDSEVGFNSPITLDIQTANTSYTPSATGHLFTDGEWYWRVRYRDEEGEQSEWTRPRSFMVRCSSAERWCST